MKKSNISEFFSRLRDANPEPKSDLNYHNNYTLLVAVALSAQATDKGVNKATHELFKVADTPQKMLDLGLDGLLDYIKTINLYPTKAKNVMSAAERLVSEFEGKVPDNRKDLVSLAGIGNKSADVVLNVAFGHGVIAVDTHIFRLSNRSGLVDEKTTDKVARKLESIVPKEFLPNAHHWLVLHGRYVCKARKPDCANCVVRDLCEYKEKTA